MRLQRARANQLYRFFLHFVEQFIHFVVLFFYAGGKLHVAVHKGLHTLFYHVHSGQCHFGQMRLAGELRRGQVGRELYNIHGVIAHALEV